MDKLSLVPFPPALGTPSQLRELDQLRESATGWEGQRQAERRQSRIHPNPTISSWINSQTVQAGGVQLNLEAGFAPSWVWVELNSCAIPAWRSHSRCLGAASI